MVETSPAPPLVNVPESQNHGRMNDLRGELNRVCVYHDSLVMIWS